MGRGLRTAWLALIIVLCTCSAARAQLALFQGRLSYQRSYATQVVSVTNKTNSAARRVEIECGFYDNNTLVSAVRSHIDMVNPGETASRRVIASIPEQVQRVSEARCRIVGSR